MKEWIFASATRIAKGIVNKEVSSVEIVELHLRRIEDVNNKIHAVVQIAGERALYEARQADSDLFRGNLKGPLHGVPVTIKDSFDTAGIITAAGTRGRASFVPQKDATVVSRLRKAGAIVLGKTNTSELTNGATCSSDNPVYGTTNNPHELSRTTSGSSGGAAAIVAAGGSPLDIGSDTGGSIREPCHYCGVAGIKPTSGRVSRTGHTPPALGVLNSLTQIGPIARYVEDLESVLLIIAGIDWMDPGIVPMPLGHSNNVNLSSLKIAVYTHNGRSTPSEDVAAAVTLAGHVMAEVVASVDSVVPPNLKDALELFLKLINADGRNWLRRQLHKAGTKEKDSSLQFPDKDRMLMSVKENYVLQEQIDSFRAGMIDFMSRFDAIICPVTLCTARRYDSMPTDMYDLWTPDTTAYNLTGYPAAVVPAVITENGLPIGVQVVGRPWHEDVVFAIAKHIEKSLGGYRRPQL